MGESCASRREAGAEEGSRTCLFGTVDRRRRAMRGSAPSPSAIQRAAPVANARAIIGDTRSALYLIHCIQFHLSCCVNPTAPSITGQISFQTRPLASRLAESARPQAATPYDVGSSAREEQIRGRSRAQSKACKKRGPMRPPDRPNRPTRKIGRCTSRCQRARGTEGHRRRRASGRPAHGGPPHPALVRRLTTTPRRAIFRGPKPPISDIFKTPCNRALHFPRTNYAV